MDHISYLDGLVRLHRLPHIRRQNPTFFFGHANDLPLGELRTRRSLGLVLQYFDGPLHDGNMKDSQKKRSMDDDFIYTISDSEGVPDEEELDPEPPKKKAKSNKKKKDAQHAEPEPSEGLWGKNDEDDGAMASDFEFAPQGINDFDMDDFAGWGFEGAKKDINGDKKGVDLDAIIERRREKKTGKSESKSEGEADEGGGESEDEVVNDLDIGLDDADDEVLADDAFGMAADDDEEEGDEEGDEQSADGEEDGPANDDASVASPAPHPDDSDDEEEEEDAEEKAKQDAFFAPEVPTSKKKGNDASFQNMSLSRPVLRGLAAAGYTKPTPIQSKTIPMALLGKDLVGGAVTGSGKTAAFVLPIIERLLFRPKKVPTTRVVILTPTRELAMQCHAVATKLACFTDIKFTLAVGGLSLKAQENELRQRPDVIIATPGRFIDHVRNSVSFSIDTVEILVLDEADRMLEDGFADELNEILTTLPKSRQTMLFSATMTSSVDQLIRVGLNKPVRLMVDSQKKTAGTLTQEFVRLRPGREDKRMGYLVWLCKNVYQERVIIFFRQKKQAHFARIVFGLLGLSCAELHGSMNQTQVCLSYLRDL